MSDLTTYPGNHRGWLIAAWVLWGLLVFADLFYLLLMQIMDLNRVNQPPPLLPLILCVTSGVIVVVAVAARLGGRAVLRADRASLGRAVGWLVLGLVSSALSLAISIYGLVCFFLNTHIAYSHGLWAAGMITLVALAPWKWTHAPKSDG